MNKTRYRFSAKVWIYPGDSAWHFVTIDKKYREDIQKSQKGELRRGFGAVSVVVTIGKSGWNTSIFPVKDGSYLLPIKKSVRKNEGILTGDTVALRVDIVRP